MKQFVADVIVIGAVGFWPIAVLISFLAAVFGDDDPRPKKTIWNAGYMGPVANVGYERELAEWEQRQADRAARGRSGTNGPRDH